ncbi:MAG: [citrate (pro-3S)-lyase] ligase [Muribaculaceae bacterium]|nr:[citrate (pro-3S)-lyase] ligase [Muribaculaceae bacterium]
MYTEYEITQQPLALKSCRTRIERFLDSNSLRLDKVDYYAVVTRLGDDKILAGGGLCGDIIKCIAVDDSLRGTGMSQRLVSHLLSEAQQRGYLNVKVYTKPGNTNIFKGLAFKTLASSPLAVLMENGIGGLDNYTQYLHSHRKDGNNGVLVMNCNPFTLGHRYLIEQAAKEVDNLYVIVVKEDVSMFSTRQRMAMVTEGCKDIANVTVLEGSDYAISALTFPTYFLKKLDDASDTHMTLDINLFTRHIAPALNARVRYVGQEPTDLLTRRYNELMKSQLMEHGINLVEIERLKLEDTVISASTVRKLLEQGNLSEAVKMVPTTTVPYLISKLATMSISSELATTPKPGLVDRNDNGAHQDMDYAVMERSIKALEPFFDQLAVMGHSNELPAAKDIQQVGIDAEKAMLEATGGVNTHRGALFSMGLAIVGISHSLATNTLWSETVKQIASQLPGGNNSNGSKAKSEHNALSALDLARDGYSDLTGKWLPYYRSINDDTASARTLLLIMSTLDDTNIIHRVGYDRAQQVKSEAKQLAGNFSLTQLEELNRQYTAENISPGGAADMLALTLFINATTN